MRYVYIVLLLFFLPLASAAYVITPVLSYNSVANTLTVSYAITPTQQSNTVAIVLNNSIQDIAINSIAINNIYITNTPISNTLATGTLAPTTNKQNITFEIPPFPKINKNTTLGYGGSYINTAYNLSVFAPKYPSAITKTLTFTPNFTTQTQKLTENNFTVNVTVNPILKINKKIPLTYSGNYINASLNLTVLAPQYPTINKKIYANASWTGVVTAYNNSALNLSVFVNQIQKLNINKTISFGSKFTNTTYGITFTTPSVTVNDINDTVLEQYYNSKVTNSTCGSYLTTNNIKVCTAYKNGTTLNVLNLCLASQFTNTSGLTDCMQRLFTDANQSAQTWKQTAQNWENLYNKTYVQLQLDNQTIKNQSAFVNQENLAMGSIFVFIGLIFAGATYLSRKKKQAVVLR